MLTGKSRQALEVREQTRVTLQMNALTFTGREGEGR